MHKLVKPFAIIISLGWMALWAVALLLMWRPASEARINATDFDALASIDAADTARWIGTAVAALAIALAVPVLLAAFRPASTSVITPASARDETQPVVPDHPDTGRVHDRDAEHADRADELPASLRRTSAEPVAVATPVEPPVVQAERTDTSSIEARLEQHEAELRRLREQLLRQNAPSNREAVLPERENGHALRDRA
jgi:hypothetical protein